MQRESASVAVDRPIQEVFDFLAEGRNNPTWRPDVILVARIAGSGGPLGVGSTFHQRVADLQGKRVDEEYEVTRYEPPHLLEFTVTRGLVRLLGSYSLAVITPATTHVEFTLRRVSAELRRTVHRDTGNQLHERVGAIARLPAAMKDQGAPLL